MHRIASFILAGVLAFGAWSTVVAVAVAAEKELWQTDFEAAKGQAKKEKKLLLVDFTGSDWCGWCIKLKKEVFDKEPFKAEAPKRFVLVELDFPHEKKMSDELKEQNEKLGKQYKVEGFPTVLLLDAEGHLVAHTGYRPGGPEEYVKHLGGLVTIFESIVEMKGNLDKAQGLDRAKLLDQIIEAYGKLDNEVEEIEPWSKEIIALDVGNKAGLQVKYQFRTMMAEAAKLKEKEKIDEAKAVYEKILALSGLSDQQKQNVFLAQGECFFSRQDFPGVISCLKKALEAAPKSDQASQIKGMIEQFSEAADAQEATIKIKADLKNAKGLDRAKLLDQLVDAQKKLAQFVPDRDLAKELEEWSKEIVSLDPENKAGLKSKYEFHILLVEAQKLHRDGKGTEAQAAIDKALALPGIKGDQVQEAQVAKGSIYFGEQEFQKSGDSFKKALDAAPESPMAPQIKMMIERCEAAAKKTAHEDKSKK